MADSNNNSGQFGSNRQDADEMARQSTGLGSEHGADPSEAGKKGAEAQSTEVKAEGGGNS